MSPANPTAKTYAALNRAFDLGLRGHFCNNTR